MHPWPRSVAVVTGVAVLNCLAVLCSAPAWSLALLFSSSPFWVIWMVWRVLTDDRVPSRTLAAQEHWGYQDRPDLRPVE